MTVYGHITANNISQLATKLNDLKLKNMKLEFVDKSADYTPHGTRVETLIEALYSYEFEKKVPKSIESKDSIVEAE